MKVDLPLVERIAILSRLKFEHEEKEEVQNDLQKILNMVDKLNELDTKGVEPLIYITEKTGALRPDEVKECLSKEDALKNAPVADSDYFKVPKVVSK